MYLESIWYDADMRSKSPATKQNASNTYKPEPTNDNRTEPRPTRWAGFLDRGCGPTTHCENATLVLVVERGQDLETRTLHGGWWFQFAVVNRQLRGEMGFAFFYEVSTMPGQFLLLLRLTVRSREIGLTIKST